MTALRWAVVGFGAFGELHASALQAGGHEVVAVVDPDPERRRAASTIATARVTGELDDALDAHPDVVVVATPEHLHRDAAVRALAVAHVLVEKPIASTIEDAEAIRAAADSAGRLVFVGHLLRFDPRLVALASLIDQGRLGDVVHLSCRRIGLRSIAATYQRVEPLVVSGVHDADLVAWLSGARACSVSATSVHRLGRPQPDHQVALFELEGGTSAVVEAGWLLPDGAPHAPNVQLDVIGTEAVAHVTDAGPLTLVTRDGAAVTDAGDPSAWSPAALLRAQYEHVATHVESGVGCERIGTATATAALRSVLAASRSSQRAGERVAIER